MEFLEKVGRLSTSQIEFTAVCCCSFFFAFSFSVAGFRVLGLGALESGISLDHEADF